MDQLEFNEAAFSAISQTRIRDLFASVGRIRALLHPAQREAVWRDGEIPQKRHLDDVPLPGDSPAPKKESITCRLDELRHDVDSALYERVKAGMSNEEVRQDAEVREKAEKLKRTEKSLQRHLSKDKAAPWSVDPNAEANRKIEKHAHGEMERRLREFANAESYIRRFLHDLNAGKWSQLPGEHLAGWRPSTWYKRVTGGLLTVEQLRRAKSDKRLARRQENEERSSHLFQN